MLRSRHATPLIQIISILAVALLPLLRRVGNLTLAILGLERENDDEQRFVRGAVFEHVSERVRTLRQQERVKISLPCTQMKIEKEKKRGFGRILRETRRAS